MDYTVTLGCMGLLVGFILFVGYPFFQSPRGEVDASVPPRVRQLLERKDQLLAAIKEAEFDRDLGKMEADEYEPLHRELQEEAVGVLQQLERLDSGAPGGATEEQIEAEVAARRQREPEPPVCAECGAQGGAQDRFCSKCGAQLGASSGTI